MLSENHIICYLLVINNLKGNMYVYDLQSASFKLKLDIILQTVTFILQWKSCRSTL